jgi:hypothetical protein
MLDKIDPDTGADLRRVDEAFAGQAELGQLSGDPGAGLGGERALRRGGTFSAQRVSLISCKVSVM